MKISTILDHIDNGHMALPEFQRGYALNRNQVRREASGKLGSRHRSQPLSPRPLQWCKSPGTPTPA